MSSEKNDQFFKWCFFGNLSGLRNKDAPFVLLLFFHFLWSFRQNSNKIKDLSLESRNIQTKNCAPIQCTLWPRYDNFHQKYFKNWTTSHDGNLDPDTSSLVVHIFKKQIEWLYFLSFVVKIITIISFDCFRHHFYSMKLWVWLVWDNQRAMVFVLWTQKQQFDLAHGLLQFDTNFFNLIVR